MYFFEKFTLKKLIIPDTIKFLNSTWLYGKSTQQIILDSLIVKNCSTDIIIAYYLTAKYLYIDNVIFSINPTVNIIKYCVIDILSISNKPVNKSITSGNNTIKYLIIRPGDATLVFPKFSNVVNIINLTAISNSLFAAYNSYSGNIYNYIPEEIRSMIPKEHLLELTVPDALFTNNLKINENTASKNIIIK